MSKGLEIIKKKKELLNEQNQDDQSVIVWDFELDIIEKELKEGEENKKMLNIFKNALTIEHHEIAELDHSLDANDYFVRTLFNIKQNQIDIAIRKALREWVLKNAFPKELKALEIIKNYGYFDEQGDLIVHLPTNRKQEHDLLKEVLL